MASLDLQNVSLTDLPQNTLEEYGKTLEAERTRADDVERMYETLKKIHEECTEEFRVSQNQTQKFYVEIEQKLQQSDDTIRELRRTIVDQVREISELKSNALTPQRQEVIKLNLQTELEKEFHGRNRNLHDENTTLKTKVSSLTYENSALRADLEARESDFRRTKNDILSKYERKIEDLKREKEVETLKVLPADMARYRELQRTNDQLDLQVRGLQSELERLRTDYTRREEESHQSQKTQTKKIAENAMLIDNLKAEKETNYRQLESLRKQLFDTTAENSQLSQTVQVIQDEKLAIQEEKEALIHQHQIQLGAERIRTLTERTSLQKEARELSAELENNKGELAAVSEGLNLQRNTFATKEHENQLTICQIKQEQATEYALLEQQKHELDIKIGDVEGSKRDLELKLSAEKETSAEQIQQFKLTCVSLQKDCDDLRTRIANYQQMETDFRQNQEGYMRLQCEVRDLLSRLEGMEETFRLLQNEKEGLETVISTWKERRLQDREELDNLRSNHAKDIASLQKECLEKRDLYTEQIKQQEARLFQIANAEHDLVFKLGACEGEMSLQKMRSQTIISELIGALRGKSKLLDMVKNYVPAEEYNALKKELDTLRNKLGRLKSMAEPNHSTSNLTELKSIQTNSAKQIGERLDRSSNSLSLIPRSQPLQDETVEELLDRLAPLGLSARNVSTEIILI